MKRYHGTYRERDKVMRGLENGMTAKQMNENMRTYYNFIRPHQALDGLTPAEMAGIDLGLGRTDRLSYLLNPFDYSFNHVVGEHKRHQTQ